MEQLQKDLETVQNYYNYLQAKLAHLQTAKTPDLDEETSSLIQRAIDGFQAELGWVTFRLESLQNKLSTPEVLDASSDNDSSRSVN